MTAVRKHFLQLNLSVAVLGLAGLFAKWVPLHPVTIITARTLFGGAALFAVLKLSGRSLKIEKAAEWRDSLFTGLLLALHWSTMFHSIQLTNVSVGLFTLYTFPVMTALLEPLLRRSLPSLPDLALSLYVFLGVTVLIPDPGSNPLGLQGVLWGLLSALLYALRNIYTKGHLHRGSIHVMFYQLLFAFLILAPTLLWTGEAKAIFVPENLIPLLLLGIPVTAFGHTLWVNSMKLFSATTSGIVSCSAPVYAALYAWILLGEVPGPKIFVGGGIILSGVALEVIRTGRRKNG